MLVMLQVSDVGDVAGSELDGSAVQQHVSV